MDRQLNILLVEDDAFDVAMFERTLRRVSPGANFTHAADVSTALDMIGSGALPKPYIVVADINMPRMSGHDLVDNLRQQGESSNNIVFMFTTSDSPQDIERAYRSRVNGYIVKPNSREGLSNILRCLQDFWNTCEPPFAAA